MKDLKIDKNDQNLMKSMKKREVVMGKVVACAFVLVTLGVMFAGVVPVAAATTWYVDDSGGADFTSIQEGVDAASPGDTIIVYPGTYTENVDVNKDQLTIKSESGADSTIVQAAVSSYPVFDVREDYVNISGFTVTGTTVWKAGIYLKNVNYCEISNNTCSNNHHGIYLGSSSSNTLTNNTANLNSYGISLLESSNNALTNNTANLNNWFGIYLHFSSSNTLTNNKVLSNDDNGIALFSSGNNTLINNNALNNSIGISLSSSDSNILTNNNATNNGHGICLSSSRNNNLANNDVSSNNWSGIYLASSSNTIYLNNFINNSENVHSSNLLNAWNSSGEITYTYNGSTYTNYLGNYWSDYSGSDTDGDGIGDIPYNIDSDKDNYPLIQPSQNYLTASVPGILYVPDDYSTIQAAVDNANAGDTIVVRDGTYTENVKVGKRLTILSENGPDRTIVQAASSSDDVFEVSADFVNISGFTATGATGYGAGIHLFKKDYCNISNNNCSYNYHYGIHLDDSASNTITNNTCSYNNGGGIYLWDSSSNSITNNTCSYNSYGIYIMWYSRSNRLRNNKMSGNRYNFGVSGDDSPNYYNDIDRSNRVEGKPIYYLVGASGTVIDSGTNAGTVYCVNCENVTVKDLTLTNNRQGICFVNTINSIILNNTCSFNLGGIYLEDSGSNSITNNNFAYNHLGIHLGDSGGNSITNNNCSYNNGDGIYLWDSSSNSITNNNYSYNNDDGIALYKSSDSNSITNNTCSYNDWHGITLGNSANNSIYLNNFFNNTDNVYFYYSTNIWNSTEKITYNYNGKPYTNYLGNYWDDYTDVDTNNDGIWDNPYSIVGDNDNNPLVEPFENYVPTPPPENQPPTASFTYSPQKPMIGEEITFDASLSTDPDGEIVSYEWDFGDGEPASGEIVTHAYSDVGDYTVTLTVTDDDGAANSSSDIIAVAVYIPKWRKNIVIGDILIDENKPEEFDWLDPDTWEEIFYNGHAGIYVGNGKVVESLLWGGVKKKGIETWDYPHKRYIYLLHVKNCTREVREEAASFAEEHVGDKYCLALDIFGKSPDGRLMPMLESSGVVFWYRHWYCSELPWAAYWHVGKDIDRDDTDEMTDEEKFNIVVLPKDILNDPDMEKVDQHPSESDPYTGIDFLAACPVDLIVTDPDGLTISKDWIDAPGAVYYTDEDYDWDGSPDDLIYISERITGDYQITVVPESGAESTDTYTLAVSAGDTTVVLAQNVQVSDIPSQPYKIKSTETTVIQIIPATIDFDPDTLNLKSEGKWVTTYIELSEGYDVSNIDVSTVMLNDQVHAEGHPIEIGDYDDDNIADLKVKFNGPDVQDILEVGDEVEITVTGELTYGTPFEGSDTIRVIDE